MIVGSGIMGEALAGGNNAVALLGNSIATGAGLYVLISLLGPFSGAHFNPAVSLMFWAGGEIAVKELVSYWIVQVVGAIAGVWVTHLMFNLPILQSSIKPRNGLGIWVSELVGTLILLSVIRIGVKDAKQSVPTLVALTITAGYWFTSSTFFCNPAVTLARSMTNTFAGVHPGDIFSFLSAQLVASILFIVLMKKAG